MKQLFLFIVFSLSVIVVHAQESKSDSIMYSKDNARLTPYQRLAFHLDETSKTRGWFTAFCNLDIDFASVRFFRYLQNSELAMAIDSDLSDYEKYSFTTKFIPRVSSGTEYIDVQYQTDENYILKKVEITGTPEIILNLFLSYWQYKTMVKDSKTGEIATHDILGDHVSLVNISTDSSKIIITPNEFDYSGSFGIEVP